MQYRTAKSRVGQGYEYEQKSKRRRGYDINAAVRDVVRYYNIDTLIVPEYIILAGCYVKHMNRAAEKTLLINLRSQRLLAAKTCPWRHRVTFCTAVSYSRVQHYCRCARSGSSTRERTLYHKERNIYVVFAAVVVGGDC